MSIQRDWKLVTTKRNFHGGVYLNGRVPVGRRTRPSKAWQRDVTRALSQRLDSPAVGHTAKDDDNGDPLPEKVRRLKALARTVMRRSWALGSGSIP